MQLMKCGLICLLTLFNLIGISNAEALPIRSWNLTGCIVDEGMARNGPIFTNTFTLAGTYADGRFVMDLLPVHTLDDVAESVGWDGKKLYLIQRWSDSPHNLPRTNALAYVEPSVFSRYASFALQSVLIAFADSNLLARLKSGDIPVILGPQRFYQEESNVYTVEHLPSGCTTIRAHSPGFELGEKGLVAVSGWDQGFMRWTHRSDFCGNYNPAAATNFWIKYDRFSPIGSQLVQNRAVTGQIELKPSTESALSFRPGIIEQDLAVLDYSSRYDIFPWTKGIVDWCSRYDLTHQTWPDDDSNLTAQVAQLKYNFRVNDGYPKELLRRANTLANYQVGQNTARQRRFVLAILIGFSVLSVVVLLLSPRWVK